LSNFFFMQMCLLIRMIAVITAAMVSVAVTPSAMISVAATASTTVTPSAVTSYGSGTIEGIAVVAPIA